LEVDFLPATTRIIPVLTSFFLIFLAIFGFDFLAMRFRVAFSYLVHLFTKHFGFFSQLLIDFFSLN
jgi:hypothetical protein